VLLTDGHFNQWSATSLSLATMLVIFLIGWLHYCYLFDWSITLSYDLNSVDRFLSLAWVLSSVSLKLSNFTQDVINLYKKGNKFSTYQQFWYLVLNFLKMFYNQNLTRCQFKVHYTTSFHSNSWPLMEILLIVFCPFL
jgi:hypothetical protein